MKYKHIGLLIVILLDISFFFVYEGKGTIMFAFSLLCFISLIVSIGLILIKSIFFFIDNWNKKIFDK